jgi:hypothetical protein
MSSTKPALNDLPQFNSNKIEAKCEEFKKTLIDKNQALAIFRVSQDFFEASRLELDKKQYKSETETEMLLAAYRAYNNSMQPTANASAALRR